MNVSEEFVREAAAYERLPDGRVRCLLCPHRCTLREGQTGLCRVRRNVGGRLVTLNYGAVSSLAVDPVEKKPLFHFYPGHFLLSLGTWGCNLHCPFCQNWEIAHGTPPVRFFSPEDVLALLDRCPECAGVAFTYSEPTVWYEYVLDTARLVRARGGRVVLVTNGFIEEAPLRELLPYVDAMNVDLKAFRPETYRRVLRGRLEPVLRTIALAAERVHVEVTTLLVTGMNDSLEEVEEITRFLASVNPEIPFHLSRYFPAYRYTEPPTPVDFLLRAFALARRHLRYVYLGNLRQADGETTFCPACGSPLLVREGFTLREVHLERDVAGNWRCPYCGQEIPILGEVLFPRN